MLNRYSIFVSRFDLNFKRRFSKRKGCWFHSFYVVVWKKVERKMTILYNERFWRTLCRWRGSVWKTVWKELIWWLLFYYIIRIILVYAVPTSHHTATKNLVALFDLYLARLPLEFLLGFFVATTVGRWWSQVRVPHNAK